MLPSLLFPCLHVLIVVYIVCSKPLIMLARLAHRLNKEQTFTVSIPHAASKVLCIRAALVFGRLTFTPATFVWATYSLCHARLLHTWPSCCVFCSISISISLPLPLRTEAAKAPSASSLCNYVEGVYDDVLLNARSCAKSRYTPHSSLPTPTLQPAPLSSPFAPHTLYAQYITPNTTATHRRNALG